LPLGYPTASDYNKISPAFKALFGGNTKVDRIILDEVSMQRADGLDMIDYKLRKVRDTDKPFGGIQMIPVGDFYQLESIVKPDEKAVLAREYKSPFAFSAKCWNFKTVELTQVVRQSDEEQIALLQSIRRKDRNYIESLMHLQDIALPYVNCPDTLHLCCYNTDADNFNNHWYSTVKSPEVTYWGIGENKDVPIPNQLRLKVGIKVLICANDLEGGYVNGDRGTIVYLGNGYVTVEKDNGDTVDVVPFTWEKYKLKSTSKGLSRSLVSSFQQLPIRLGWAVSIHKSQGMSLDRAAIDIGKGCFGHGQFYVAVSRVRNLNNLSFVRHVSPKNVILNPAVDSFYKSLGDI
jgi:ATP-dependent DNA helicase PIF1